MDDNGALIYKVEQKEVDGLMLNEEELKAQFDRYKEANEVWEVDEEDEDAFRFALMQELQKDDAAFKLTDFEAVLDKELAIFTKGEKYSYVKDMKHAYKDTMAQTTEQKIFATIPDHYFWDIKAPQRKKDILKKNRYNPFRGAEFDNFFEMRNSEEYMERNHHKKNLNDASSLFTRY